MALIEPCKVEPLDALGAVHFIAIGGAGMSGIAAAYAARGVSVSGSDRDDSPTLRQLAALGVKTYVGHDGTQLGNAATVVVSSAIKPDNVELVEARRRGLRVLHRSAALATLMLGRRGIAISGTHGKTTTTGMVATMLVGAGVDPGYVIGSPLASTGESSALGTGDAFVVEADESDGSFLQYPAEIVVVTNIEADHMDNWGTRDAYEDGFFRLCTAAAVRTVIMNADDARCTQVAERVLAAGKEVVLVGQGGDVRLTDIRIGPGINEAKLIADDDEGLLRLAVPGRFNLSNAAAAYAVGRALGLSGIVLREALGMFTGTHRRFEFRGVCCGVKVYDDYAHHPTEVAAILGAARPAVPEGGRLVACFQPHLFSRTRDFEDEFVEALSLADVVLIAGIYPARERAADFPGVTAAHLGERVAERGVAPLVKEDLAQVPAALADLVKPGDLVLTIGAGSVTTVGPALLALLGTDA